MSSLFKNVRDFMLQKMRLSIRVAIRGSVSVANQRILLRGSGVIEFAEGVVFGWEQSPSFETSYAYVEARRPGSKIVIGRKCIFSNAPALIAECEGETPAIQIGDRCVFGSRFRCYDSDFDGLRAKERNEPNAIKRRPVKIGNDCFFGEACFVLKGVEIGDRCVVGAGSVVTTSFPPDSIIAGNPARLVRTIAQNS